MKLSVCVFALCALAFANANRCEIPCTREYLPVCGTDGQHTRLFPTACVMRNQHCRDGHNWVQTRLQDCVELAKKEHPCEVRCTREYNPVCGTDGQRTRLFPTTCVMGNQHCFDGHNWFQTRMEDCAPVAEEDQPCEVPCTREYNPVCGTDGQYTRLFPTACVMRNQHCRDGHNWFQTRMEDCDAVAEEDQPCEIPCTREFLQVCGTDGEHFKLFNNLCMLRNEHCKDGHNWLQTRVESCSVDEVDELAVQAAAHKNCAPICPALYAPVCGFDGQVYKQFANKCMLESNNCRYNNHWEIVGLGECA